MVITVHIVKTCTAYSCDKDFTAGSPYLTWAMSPTTMSATGIWMTFPFRTTVNFCSCSIRLCRPRNCFSLDQSLKAVTRTTQATDSRMAAPSIQLASPSPSSSAPADKLPHAGKTETHGSWQRLKAETWKTDNTWYDEFDQDCGNVCLLIPFTLYHAEWVARLEMLMIKSFFRKKKNIIAIEQFKDATF